MKSQMYVLPVQCRTCGATFDLWHDLLEQGEVEMGEFDVRGLGEKEHLCWRCRQKSTDEKENTEISIEEGDFTLEWE